MLPITLATWQQLINFNLQTTPISTFYVTFCIFIVGEHTDFKFSMQVNCR